MEICLLGLLVWCFHLEILWAARILQHQRSAPPKARTPKTKDWMSSSSSSSLASTFTWVPTLNLEKADPQESETAVAFLYSGDVVSLSQANCTKSFEVRDMGKVSGPAPALRSSLHGATDTLTHATNFLNMVFQTNDIRESSVKEDVEWYHALVRSVIEGDPQVYRTVLTFDAHPVSSKPQLMIQATKENNQILLKDLSASAENLRNLTWENEWYNFFWFQKTPILSKRILYNDLKTLDTPKWSQGDSYVLGTSHIRWSPPFLECEDGKFLPNWMITLSSSFYGLKPDLNPEFKGVVRMDVKIQNVDINQCATGQGWFANTHQCDLNSTQCIPQENQGFVLGRYVCLCKPGFYGISKASPFPSTTNNDQSEEDASQYGVVDSGNLLECHPCQEGCSTCIDGTPCLVREDWSLRAAVLAFQAFCMLAVFFSMLVSYHFRKSKRIRASGVVLLETILFGSLLLYFPVFILYFKPSIFRCIVLRWVRMLGFAIVYGTITLKLYRVLKIFLSRTAQRVPYMSSGRVLKMLALILLLVLWFLAAWTVGMLENIEKNIPLVVLSQTTGGLQFYICDHDRWDYMMVVAEMLFLLWGSFLCYATRTIPSAFHEPRYMGVALHNELITSTAFHFVRFFMVPSLHPDWTLLLFFVHTHVTTTMTLALLFIPKFLHAGSPLQEEIAAEVYEDELDLKRSGSCLNSSLTSAWSEHSLDPDDIRDELKKLYIQLEVNKTKKMVTNNPHLQKKRSSKRGLGRSLMRRITEIPESMSRQYSKEEKDGSVEGGGMSRSGSYKGKNLDSSSSSMKVKDDASAKQMAASLLKKSHSTYDQTRDTRGNNVPTRHGSYKEAPLHDSLMKKKLAKKASEKSNSDSLDDSAPLVYRSVSAHNLMAERKPLLYPKPPPLQKSLSTVTSAKEKALLLMNRAYLEDSSKLAQDKEKKTVVEDSSTENEVSGHPGVTDAISGVSVKDLQRGNTSERTVSSLLEGDSSQDTVHPCESVATPSMPQKHVTYAPFRSVSINISELPGRRHQAGKKIPPEPPIRQQSLCHSLERKDVISWDAKDQTQASSQSLKKDPKDIPVLAHVCPSEMKESVGKPEMQGVLQAKDNALQSSPAELTRLASLTAEVCPWEGIELPTPKKKDPEVSELDSLKSSPEKLSQSLQVPISKSTMKSLGLAIRAFNQSRLKASIRAKKDEKGSQKAIKQESSEKNETLQTVGGTLMSVKESPKQQVISGSPKKSRPKIVSKQSTICPWDEEEEASPSSHKNSLGNVFEVCPWEASKDGLTQGSTEAMPSTCADEISPDRLDRINSQRESVCPWETIDNVQTRGGEAQEEASGLHGSKDNKELSLATEIKKSPDLSKPEQKKTRSVESHKFSSSEVEEIRKSTKTQICPWEGEELPSKPAMSVEDKEGSSRTESTTRTAAIKTYQEESTCSWETITGRINAQSQRASDNKANIKTAMCPWETSGVPPEEPRKESREDTKEVGDRKLRSPLLEETKDRQSIAQEAVCPWENASAEDSSAKPAGKTLDHNKVVLNNFISGDSKNVEVCPWETKTAEVCPWEVVSSTLEKGVGEMEEKASKGITLKTLSPLKALEGNMKHESVCPWEDTKAETTLLKPSTKPLGPSRASSYSFQTKKAEIVPWETQEAGIDTKTAICPWESGDAPVMKREFAKDAGSVSKEEKQGTKHTAPEEEGNNKRESVHPWESAEDKGVSVKRKPHISKFSSKKSVSSESLKTAVYPWETEDTEVSTKDLAGALGGKGSIVSNKTDSLKAEVCPWESQKVEPSIKADACPWEWPESPTDQRTSLKGAGALESHKIIPLKQTGDSKITEKASSPRENICPWETMGTNDPSTQPSNESSGLSKSRSDTLKSEVCPWESQKVEPSTKTDVCPGNESISSVDKRQSLKRAEAFESSKSTSLEQMAHFKSVEKMSSPQESVCPWDNVNPSELSPKPEQFKLTSKKSGSVESLKAEVCPWEVFEEGVLGHEDDSKAHQRKESRTTFPMTISKAMERLSRSKEEVCPWESMELEEPSGRSADQILSKAGSKKNGSTESLRSEICPWEFTEEKEESTQVDVCPWAVTVAPFVKGKLKQDLTGALKRKKDHIPPRSSDSRKRGKEPSFKKIEKSKSHQESANIWESMEFNKPPAKSTRSLDLLQVGCKKSESAESLKAEVCPWESQEVPNRARAEIFPSEVAEGLPERRNLKNYQDTVSSDGTSTKPTARTMKTEAGGSSQHNSVSSGESVELSHSQTSKVSTSDSKKSVSVESVRAEICPWETEEEPSDEIERYPTKTAPEPFNEGSLKQNISQGKTQLSPVVIKVEGEALSKRIEKTCSYPGLAYSQKSNDKQPITSSSKSLDLSKVASVKSESVEHPKAEICPWEIQEAGAITKAEVCPWEVAGAPTDRETSSRGEAAISKRDLKVDLKTPVETARTLEKGSSIRYAASSQESPAAADVLLSKTSASPSSKKPDSSKSKKTEICPWEAEQVEKEEPCPWEARKMLPTKDERPTTDTSVAEMSGVSVKRSQSKQEGLPGHKPLCRSLPETSLPVDFCRGSSSMVDTLAKSRHDGTTVETRPCETEKDTTSTRKDSSTTTKTLPEVCPWEMEGSSSMVDTLAKSRHDGTTVETRPCETEKDTTSTRKDSSTTTKTLPEVCPWEMEGSSPISTKSKSGGKSPSDKEESPCKAKSDICPWDCE